MALVERNTLTTTLRQRIFDNRCNGIVRQSWKYRQVIETPNPRYRILFHTFQLSQYQIVQHILATGTAYPIDLLVFSLQRTKV